MSDTVLPTAPEPNHARVSFTGQIVPASFRRFCEFRAQKLSLAQHVVRIDERQADVAVTGHPTLIDMFEMACSLGPEDSIVHTVRRLAG